MIIYKVRNKEGLYWEGHSWNNFTQKGKTWKKLNHVKSAITNAKTFPKTPEGRCIYTKDKNLYVLPEFLLQSVIVEFELVEKNIINII